MSKAAKTSFLGLLLVAIAAGLVLIKRLSDSFTFEVFR